MEYKNSSSISRYSVLKRKIETSGVTVKSSDTILNWLSSHENAPFSPCRHPEGNVTGQTLGTVVYDFNKKSMKLYKSNPCISTVNKNYYEYGF